MGPLEGLKVVELAHIMAGPVCWRMLADLGADVIKVEKLPEGDPSRSFVPPDIGGEAAAFLMLNRDKRGIAVDLKTDSGREIVRKLLARADVAIENYRAGTMERLGLGYDSLREENPGLIFCEISGFGRTGPYAHLGGFDLIAQGYSGVMSITGEGPGRPPVKCGAPLTDITAGILAAMAVIAAYVHPLRTGRGQRVDTSLFEARHYPDLLAGRHCPGHRHTTGAHGFGPSAQRPLSVVPDRGRMDQHRGGQPVHLAPPGPGPGDAGAGCRPEVS